MANADVDSLACALQLDCASAKAGLGLAWCPLSGLLAIEIVQERGFALQLFTLSTGQVFSGRARLQWIKGQCQGSFLRSCVYRCLPQLSMLHQPHLRRWCSCSGRAKSMHFLPSTPLAKPTASPVSNPPVTQLPKLPLSAPGWCS